MGDPMEKLTRTIMAHTNGAAIDVYNDLENYAACSGIHTDEDHDDVDNACKAIWNHYGHFGFKGCDVPAREYITNAISNGGKHKRIPSATLGLQRVLYEAIQNSVKRQKVEYKDIYNDKEGRVIQERMVVSGHGPKAFGATNSPKEVVRKVAEQMLMNQLIALDNVLPENSDFTLARKKKRSDKPLIDYGNMRAATRCWVEYDGEEE